MTHYNHGETELLRKLAMAIMVLGLLGVVGIWILTALAYGVVFATLYVGVTTLAALILELGDW